MRLRDVLLAAFPEPAERDRRAQLFLLGRHDVVAAFDELLPGNLLRQIGRVEQTLNPIDFVDTLREVVGKSEPLADLVEDPVVGLRLAERLDGRRLEQNDAVVELLLAVVAVAAERRPLADVYALETGAGR